MATVYVLTFDAQWLQDRKVVRGTHSYPITASDGEFDAEIAIAVCQIYAAGIGTILYPENGVDVKTDIADMGEPVMELSGIRVH